MINGNTIDPIQLSDMADQTNYDQANSFIVDDFANNYGLGDIDLDVENFDTFDLSLDPNPETIEENSGYADSALNDPMALTPLENFGPSGPSYFAPIPQEMAPMQQSYNPLPVASTPTQVMPAVPPGLAYHPDVGWYYPAPPPPEFAPTPLPAQQQIPFVPQFNAAPDVQSTTKPGPSRSSPKHTRKYGPGAYLDEQAKRRADGDNSGPRPVSRDYIDFHYQGRNTRSSPRITPDRTTGTTPRRKKQFPANEHQARMHELRTATVQGCQCPAAKQVKKNHIPRPRNSFIIFRTDFAAQWRTSMGKKRGKSSTNISCLAGAAWHAASAAEKAPYQRRADAEAEEHRRQNPNYRYGPVKGIQARFGQPDCKCGAYRVNCAELQRLRDGAPTPDNNFKAVVSENETEEGDYAAPVTRSQSRNNSLVQAPIAQAAPLTFDFGFDFYANAAQNAAAGIAPPGYSNAAAIIYETPVTRRSARNEKKKVHYSDGDDEIDYDTDGDMTNTAPRKHRPAQISTSRNDSPKMFDFIFGNEGSVGSRTRSKSLSSDQIDSLFGDSGDVDMGENIVVATPMTGGSNVSPKHRSRRQSRGR